MHADSLFPCRMKSGIESDSKGFSPGGSIRQLAIKKDGKKEKRRLIVFASLCAMKKNILKATQELQDEYNLLIK